MLTLIGRRKIYITPKRAIPAANPQLLGHPSNLPCAVLFCTETDNMFCFHDEPVNLKHLPQLDFNQLFSSKGHVRNIFTGRNDLR